MLEDVCMCCLCMQRDNRETLEAARKIKEEDAAARQAIQVKFSGAIQVRRS